MAHERRQHRQAWQAADRKLDSKASLISAQAALPVKGQIGGPKPLVNRRNGIIGQTRRSCRSRRRRGPTAIDHSARRFHSPSRAPRACAGRATPAAVNCDGLSHMSPPRGCLAQRAGRHHCNVLFSTLPSLSARSRALIHGPVCALPSDTQGGSRVPEFGHARIWCSEASCLPAGASPASIGVQSML